jgi:hypothetical protein
MSPLRLRSLLAHSLVILLVAACTTSVTSTVTAPLSNDDGSAEAWKDQGSELLALPDGLEPLSVATTGWVVSGAASTTVTVVDGELAVDGSPSTVLEGARFTATAPNIPALAMRINAVIPHDHPSSGPGLAGRYEYVVEYLDEEQVWRRLCPDEHPGAMVIPGSFGIAPTVGGASPKSNGDYDPTDGQLTFSCRDGVAAKCVDWGYPPWTHGTEMVPYFQGCTRMARADYCGIGRSRTVEGTLISFRDLHDPPMNNLDPPPDFVPEAVWGRGRGTQEKPAAICVSRTRWSTIPLGARSLCADLMPDPRSETGAPQFCEDTPLETWAREGALFTNSSLPLDVGVYVWTDGAGHYTTTTRFPWLGPDVESMGPPGYPQFVSIEGSTYKPTLPPQLRSGLVLVPLYRYTKLGAAGLRALTTTDTDPGHGFGDRVLEAYVFGPSDEPPVPTAQALYLFHADGDTYATGTGPTPMGFTRLAHLGWLPH